MKNPDPFQFARLLLSYRKKDISDKDREHVESALEEFPFLMALNEELSDNEKIGREISIMSSFNTEKALSKISPSGKKIYLSLFSRVAAVAVLLVGFSALLFILSKPEKQVYYSETAIKGGSKVTLHLANGTTLAVDTISAYRSGNQVILRNEGGILSVTDKLAAIKDEKIQKFNRLEVPYKTKFKIELQDGTVVWLNSGSTLDFPSEFSGNERKVILSGEAFFEVIQNEKMKFIVETDKGFQVEVLGTSFNVKSYKDEPFVYTTLVKGSVSLNDNSGTFRKIVPGEQATYNRDDHSYGVRFVNTSPYTAWKDGIFYFEDATLEDIMRRVGRWYGLDIVYRSSGLMNLVYSGKMQMYDSVDDVLRKFEKSGDLSFELEDNAIKIRRID